MPECGSDNAFFFSSGFQLSHDHTIMQQSKQPKTLLDEDGIQITNQQITTANGEFPLQDIEAVESRITKPVWGPLLLGILGTLNLAIAFQAAFWLDFVASGIMLGGGLFWWTRGTKYVLTLRLPQGKVDIWFARRESQMQKALDIVQQRLDKRRSPT